MGDIDWTHLLVGGIFCYLGFPLFQVSLLTFGFVAGGGVGFLLGEHLYDSQVWSLGIGVIGGLAGIIVLKFFVRAGLFLAGCLLGTQAGAAFSHEPMTTFLCGLAGGVLFVFASRVALILATSLLGAVLVAKGVTTIPALEQFRSEVFGAGVFLSCLISGVIVQFQLSKKE